MTPWAIRHKFLCAVLGWFCGKQSPPTGFATRIIAWVIGGIVTPLTTRFFRDGTFVGNCARFRSAEFSSCGSCCDGPLEAILPSCLEGVTPVSATDGPWWNITFLCGGRISFTWRSRNVVPRIQSTARLVTTRNGTHAQNSPIWTCNLSSPRALIDRFDASMSGGLRADLMAAGHGSATQRRWIRFAPAPESRTRVMAHISARRCPTVAVTL